MMSAITKYIRVISRLSCLLAYALSFFLAHYVQPIVAKAYNDLCAAQGATFGNGISDIELLSIFAVLSIVTFLTRSTILLVTNSVVSFIKLFGAVLLLSTAGNTPYECFTSAGTYEDNTSGLEGFGLWVASATVFLVAFLCVDLTVRIAVRFWRKASIRVARVAPTGENE
jgi:hypothetical protein